MTGLIRKIKKRRRANLYGVKVLGRRKHKGKYFYPKFRAKTKGELRDYLIKSQLAHTNYYRIFHHKARGYTLYIGPPKESHGGIRHRPTNKMMKRKREKEFGKKRQITTAYRKAKEKKKRPVKTFTLIKEGKQKGRFKDEEGKLYSSWDVSSFRAHNKNKYNFVVNK